MCVHTSTILTPVSLTPLPKESRAHGPSATCCTKMTSQPPASPFQMLSPFPSIKGSTPLRPSPPSLVLQTALGGPSYQDPHTVPAMVEPQHCLCLSSSPAPSEPDWGADTGGLRAGGFPQGQPCQNEGACGTSPREDFPEVACSCSPESPPSPGILGF